MTPTPEPSEPPDEQDGWTTEDVEEQLDHYHLRRAWTDVSGPCDPVGDLNVAAAQLALDRPLTAFEEVVLRGGLGRLRYSERTRAWALVPVIRVSWKTLDEILDQEDH